MSERVSDYDLDGATGYHYGQFPPNELDYKRLIGPLRRAASKLAQYDTILSSLHNQALLLAPLKQQEAVFSSRMEGTVATLDEVMSFEAEVENDADDNESARERYRLEVQEVHSYTRALNRAQDLLGQGLPICGRVYREAHRRMLFWGRGADKQPGEFKTEQNYVVDRLSKQVQFVPISAEKLDEGFEAFERYVNDPEIDPLIKTAISHIEFEALHPFKDGNGRVGRMMITLMLWHYDIINSPSFYVSGFFEEHKEDYISNMRRVSEQGEWTEWCEFFLGALSEQADQNIETARRIMALYDEMKEQFRQLLASQWTTNALDYIFSRPIFRNSHFTNNSGIPKQTAARFSRVLSEQGLLRTVYQASGQRPATYAFDPLLDIVRA